MQFNSIETIHRALSGATIPGQWTGEQWQWRGAAHSPSSSITGNSPSDCLVSYPGYSLVRGVTPLQRSSRYFLQPQPTEQGIAEWKRGDVIDKWKRGDGIAKLKSWDGIAEWKSGDGLDEWKSGGGIAEWKIGGGIAEWKFWGEIAE